MKFNLLIFFCLISNLISAQDQKLDNYKTENINNIIRLFRQKNVDAIIKIVNFPLKRESPIPAIENEQALKQRFNQVFDSNLIATISNSKISQWSEVGWRGIMLDNGTLWIDSDGKISAVNYQSSFEKDLRKKLIAKQKQALHVSLKNFVRPIYKIQTKNYLIRIDELKNGKYRYACWKANSTESSKPALVLVNGIREFSGSGGNEEIRFSNGAYNYKIYRNQIGADDDPEVSLEVQKNGKPIISEDGKLR